MASEFWFPWYPAHYRRDAGHLDHLSDSCYRRLLDAYMEGGEPIKKDAVRLMAIMRVSAEQFALIWPQIEGFFTLSPKGFLHHKRCDIELDRQDANVKQKSIAGIRSAEKRKEIKEQYQLLINDRSTPVPTAVNERTPNEMKLNEIEQIKEQIDSSIGERVPASRIRASAAPLPKGWVPSTDQVQFAERMGLVNGTVSREAAKFENYWTAGRGAGTRRTLKGWNQTWANWVDRAAKDPRNSRSDNGTAQGNRHPRSDQSAGFAGLRAQARQAARDGGSVED